MNGYLDLSPNVVHPSGPAFSSEVWRARWFNDIFQQNAPYGYLIFTIDSSEAGVPEEMKSRVDGLEVKPVRQV
jgi:hypothetical protein